MGPSARFGARARPGYRTAVDRLELGGRPAVRIVRAPVAWDRWSRLPVATAERP
jgi:hypothetical protein